MNKIKWTKTVFSILTFLAISINLGAAEGDCSCYGDGNPKGSLWYITMGDDCWANQTGPDLLCGSTKPCKMGPPFIGCTPKVCNTPCYTHIYN